MEDKPMPSPQQIRQRIQALTQSRIVIEAKLERLWQLQKMQQAEIDKLTQLL